MRNSALTTICRTSTSEEAQTRINMLRDAGLHPADLALSAPITGVNAHPSYPVQVPAGEVDAARRVLNLPSEEAA